MNFGQPFLYTDMIIVYAKWKGNDGKFHAFNLRDGVPAGNIVYASLFRDEQLDTVSEMMQELCDNNKAMELKIQLRKADCKKVLWQSK